MEPTAFRQLWRLSEWDRILFNRYAPESPHTNEQKYDNIVIPAPTHVIKLNAGWLVAPGPCVERFALTDVKFLGLRKLVKLNTQWATDTSFAVRGSTNDRWSPS